VLIIYHYVLQNDFVYFLTGYGVDIDKARFLQDCAVPHTAGIVLNSFEETFGNRMTSKRFPHVYGEYFAWPPLSPDLNPSDISYGDISRIKYFTLTLAQ
jgi:hypothetical protein